MFEQGIGLRHWARKLQVAFEAHGGDLMTKNEANGLLNPGKLVLVYANGMASFVCRGRLTNQKAKIVELHDAQCTDAASASNLHHLHRVLWQLGAHLA